MLLACQRPLAGGCFSDLEQVAISVRTGEIEKIGDLR
jgi:hypothetical protein